MSAVLRALCTAADPMQAILGGAAAAAELPRQGPSQTEGPAVLPARRGAQRALHRLQGLGRRGMRPPANCSLGTQHPLWPGPCPCDM